jgi:hypothetical protein
VQEKEAIFSKSRQENIIATSAAAGLIFAILAPGILGPKGDSPTFHFALCDEPNRIILPSNPQPLQQICLFDQGGRLIQGNIHFLESPQPTK